MADLPSRTIREDELAAALILLLPQFEDQFARGFGFEQFESAVRSTLAPALAATFLAAARQAADERNLASALLLLNVEESAAAWSSVYSQALARQIADRVRSAATTAQVAGKSIADAIRSTLASSRFESIAITEITRAVTAGQEFAAAAVIAVNGDSARAEAIWTTAEDDRVCEICQPLDQQPRDVWEKEQPLGPPAHPRCRCYLDYRAS